MLPAQFEVSQSEHTTELRRSEACLPGVTPGLCGGPSLAICFSCVVKSFWPSSDCERYTVRVLTKSL